MLAGCVTGSGATMIGARHRVGGTLLVLFVAMLLPATGCCSYVSQSRRVQANMRYVGAALEAYHVDHGSYPVAVEQYPDPDWKSPAPLEDEFKVRERHWVARNRWEWYLTGLGTTFGVLAVLYLAGLVVVVVAGYRNPKSGARKFADYYIVAGVLVWLASIANVPAERVTRNPHFASQRKDLNYWSDGKTGWVLQSVGPDMTRSLDNLTSLPLDGARRTDAYRSIIDQVYDPTNGVVSPGDLLLFKEDLTTGNRSR
jgi:hypothetical protein